MTVIIISNDDDDDEDETKIKKIFNTGTDQNSITQTTPRTQVQTKLIGI